LESVQTDPSQPLSLCVLFHFLYCIGDILGAVNVTAVEVDHELFNIAKEVLQLNKMSDKVNLINKHSTQLQVGPEGDIHDKADILE
jgi:hypothetical protein